MKNEVMVSIIMLTYNHEEYIKRALDSILMQKVNFQYEIIIGDDCSLDKTSQILKEYKKKYQDIFKLFIRKKNIGATKNAYDLYMRAGGKYIAHLEGDDYWIDEFKLQKQVEFLEANPDYIACMHKCVFVNKKGLLMKEVPINNGFCNHKNYTKKDYENGIMPGQVATWMHKNIFKDRSIDCSIVYKANNIVGDWTMTLILMTHGKIYCLSDIMSHYRQVKDKQSTSWSAMQENGNVRYEYFKTQMILENYSKNLLGQEINFKRRKKDIYASAVFKFMREPSMRNMKIVFKIIKESEEEIYYSIFGIYLLTTKLLYKILYKDDRRVKY